MKLYKRLPQDLQKKVRDDIKKMLNDEIVEGKFRFGAKLEGRVRGPPHGDVVCHKSGSSTD
tara:strand:- start:1820 stop:2002 length:183 start_codon:yes stop_codon:yes gene_type:complete